MNLEQIKASGFKVFNRQRPANKEANIVAIQYIESIASRTNTNISGWDLQELFGNKDARREFDFIKDKNEINRIFFETEAKFREDGDAELQHIKKMVSERAIELSNARKMRMIQDAEAEYNASLRQASDYAQRSSEYTRSAYTHWSRLQHLQNSPNPIGDEVIAVMRENFWKYRTFNGQAIQYETRSDIILTEINPAAGLDLRVNLGKFVASISLSDMRLQVYPLKNFESTAYYLMVGAYYHPHISSGNEVCWGDAGPNAKLYQTQGKLSSLMNLLASLLSSYSSANPYRSLAEFQQVADARLKKEALDGQEAQETATSVADAANYTIGTHVPNFRWGGQTTASAPFTTATFDTAFVDEAVRAQERQRVIASRGVEGRWEVSLETTRLEEQARELERIARSPIAQSLAALDRPVQTPDGEDLF